MKPNLKLEPKEWNFEAVPDDELVACCYWEYARESAFIRGLRQRSWDHWRPLYLKDRWWDAPEDPQLHRDLERAKSIGYAAEVFLRGIACPPDGVLPDALPLKKGEVERVTGSFPKPWQELTAPERAYRSRIRSNVEHIPLVPFQRALCLDAKAIVESVTARRSERDAANEKARRQNPNVSDEKLCRDGKLNFPEIRPSLFWNGGGEVTVVTINWGSFTNDDLVRYFREWVRENRPQQAKPPDARGRKAKDWRVQLTRLAVMRLLSRFSARQLVADDRFPEVWRTRQFGGKKWSDVTKWRDARREAGALFRRFFPFVPKEEKPLSWERRPTAR